METMVGVDCDCSYEVFLQHLAEHGFSLRFQDSMAWLDEQPDQVDFPDQLLQSGLCIPSCVAYLTGRVAEVAGNIARLAGTQSYAAWARPPQELDARCVGYLVRILLYIWYIAVRQALVIVWHCGSMLMACRW